MLFLLAQLLGERSSARKVASAYIDNLISFASVSTASLLPLQHFLLDLVCKRREAISEAVKQFALGLVGSEIADQGACVFLIDRRDVISRSV
ncbi:hypothetical protein AAE026_10080 [Bradyrhizobium sp. DN5]|uniref:hypothetical protein n=1 Tax=Bradyrhizobium sp. DN5 TaxID=3056950 RepID=UPI0035242CA6